MSREHSSQRKKLCVSVLQNLPISMELIAIRSRPISIAVLFLLLLYMPYISAGRSFDVSDKEVYEIDYRGPETHSSVPPPDNSHHHRHQIHRGTDTLPSAEALKISGGIGNKGRSVKKIHG